MDLDDVTGSFHVCKLFSRLQTGLSYQSRHKKVEIKAQNTSTLEKMFSFFQFFASQPKYGPMPLDGPMPPDDESTVSKLY